jgi:hypothetical protein
MQPGDMVGGDPVVTVQEQQCPPLGLAQTLVSGAGQTEARRAYASDRGLQVRVMRRNGRGPIVILLCPVMAQIIAQPGQQARYFTPEKAITGPRAISHPAPDACGVVARQEV